jgi:hypothetical protein
MPLPAAGIGFSVVKFLLEVVPPVLKWMGLRDEHIRAYMDFVKAFQKEAPQATVAADEESAALAALAERIRKEGGGQ